MFPFTLAGNETLRCMPSVNQSCNNDRQSPSSIRCDQSQIVCNKYADLQIKTRKIIANILNFMQMSTVYKQPIDVGVKSYSLIFNSEVKQTHTNYLNFIKHSEFSLYFHHQYKIFPLQFFFGRSFLNFFSFFVK